MSAYLKNNISEIFIIQGHDGTLKPPSKWFYDSLQYRKQLYFGLSEQLDRKIEIYI